MSYNIIRIGNLVQYQGGLSEYRNRIGEVISIDIFDLKITSFDLKIQNWSRQENKIKAYENEIWPIALDANILDKLGFHKVQQRNVFSNGQINLIRPVFFKTFEGHPLIDDKGFVVVKSNLPVPFSEQQMELNTISVPSLHTFQNYLDDMHNVYIDKMKFL